MSDFVDSANTPDPADSPERLGLVSSTSAPQAGQVSAAWESTARDEATAEPHTGTKQAVVPRVELSDVEARVLGSLIEKSFLTPDTYPMTTNAMVTACNQKTNRDPVVDYSAVIIDGALLEMRQRNLVRRVHSAGSRSTKHRQTLDETLGLDERELALMSVLLLRGPQTIGELRLRTERHDVGFDGLDAVETCLVGLSNRATPLVTQLQRQPGHKEARWRQLLSVAGEAEQAAATAPAPSNAPTAEAPTTVAPAAVAPAQSTAESPELVTRVADLESQVATLRRQLSQLAEQLGESLD